MATVLVQVIFFHFTGMLYSLEEDLRDPIGQLQEAVSVP